MRWERLLKRAAFQVRKTLDDYEWDVLRLPAALPPEEVTSCNFVRMKRNLVLYGSVGTGKTHRAIALGVAACEVRLETRFFTAASLATKLDEARRGGTLEKLIQSIDWMGLPTPGKGTGTAPLSADFKLLRTVQPDHYHQPGVFQMGHYFYR